MPTVTGPAHGPSSSRGQFPTPGSSMGQPPDAGSSRGPPADPGSSMGQPPSRVSFRGPPSDLDGPRTSGQEDHRRTTDASLASGASQATTAASLVASEGDTAVPNPCPATGYPLLLLRGSSGTQEGEGGPAGSALQCVGPHLTGTEPQLSSSSGGNAADNPFQATGYPVLLVRGTPAPAGASVTQEGLGGDSSSPSLTEPAPFLRYGDEGASTPYGVPLQHPVGVPPFMGAPGQHAVGTRQQPMIGRGGTLWPAPGAHPGEYPGLDLLSQLPGSFQAPRIGGGEEQHTPGGHPRVHPRVRLPPPVGTRVKVTREGGGLVVDLPRAGWALRTDRPSAFGALLTAVLLLLLGSSLPVFIVVLPSVFLSLICIFSYIAGLFALASSCRTALLKEELSLTEGRLSLRGEASSRREGRISQRGEGSSLEEGRFSQRGGGSSLRDGTFSITKSFLGWRRTEEGPISSISSLYVRVRQRPPTDSASRKVQPSSHIVIQEGSHKHEVGPFLSFPEQEFIVSELASCGLPARPPVWEFHSGD